MVLKHFPVLKNLKNGTIFLYLRLRHSVTSRNATPILVLSKYYFSRATACSWALKIVQPPYASGTLFCNRFMQPLVQPMGIFV